jgi:hypothetical protein
MSTGEKRKGYGSKSLKNRKKSDVDHRGCGTELDIGNKGGAPNRQAGEGNQGRQETTRPAECDL